MVLQDFHSFIFVNPCIALSCFITTWLIERFACSSARIRRSRFADSVRLDRGTVPVISTLRQQTYHHMTESGTCHSGLTHGSWWLWHVVINTVFDLFITIRYITTYKLNTFERLRLWAYLWPGFTSQFWPKVHHPGRMRGTRWIPFINYYWFYIIF